MGRRIAASQALILAGKARALLQDATTSPARTSVPSLCRFCGTALSPIFTLTPKESPAATSSATWSSASRNERRTRARYRRRLQTMNGLNRVLLIGNLTRDPVTRRPRAACPSANSAWRSTGATARPPGRSAMRPASSTSMCLRSRPSSAAVTCARAHWSSWKVALRLDQWEDKATNQKRSRLKVTQSGCSSSTAATGKTPGRAVGVGRYRSRRPAAPRAASAPYARPAPPAPASAPGSRGPAPQGPPPQEREPEMPASAADEEAVDDIPF